MNTTKYTKKGQEKLGALCASLRLYVFCIIAPKTCPWKDTPDCNAKNAKRREDAKEDRSPRTHADVLATKIRYHYKGTKDTKGREEDDYHKVQKILTTKYTKYTKKGQEKLGALCASLRLCVLCIIAPKTCPWKDTPDQNAKNAKRREDAKEDRSPRTHADVLAKKETKK